jgi:hypothetical protein
MFQLSSGTTLFYKIFLPCIWLAFFGTFVLAVFMLEDDYIGGYPIEYFRIGLVLFFLLGFVFFWFTVFKLKRVDASDTHFHISNYFKNFRYPVADIESIRVRDIGIATVAKMTLLAEGSFGKKIYFLLSKRNVQKYLVAFPEGNGLFTDLP